MTEAIKQCDKIIAHLNASMRLLELTSENSIKTLKRAGWCDIPERKDNSLKEPLND